MAGRLHDVNRSPSPKALRQGRLGSGSFRTFRVTNRLRLRVGRSMNGSTRHHRRNERPTPSARSNCATFPLLHVLTCWLVWLSLLPALALAQAPTSPSASGKPGAGQAAAALDDYKLAIGLYQDGRWQLAAEAFQRFLKLEPRHPKAVSARFYLALCLENVGDFRQARDLLRQVVAEQPRDPLAVRALYRIGECSYFLDDLPAAERELKAFLRRSPNDPLAEYAYPYLGDAQLRLGKFREAADSFRQALKVAPKGKLAQTARFGLARALEKLGQTDQAVSLYRQLASDVKSAVAAEAAFRLAAILFDAGQYAQAAERFDRLEQTHPSSPLVGAALVNAGLAYYQLGQYERAAQRFQKARDFPDQSVTAGYWLALCWKAEGRLEAAAELLSKLDRTRATPDVAEGATFQQADCLMRLGRFAKAAPLFETVAEQWPNGEFADDALLLAAECRLVTDDPTQADRLLKQFEQRFPDSPLQLYARLLRARLLTSSGKKKDLEQAARTFEQILHSSRVPRTRLMARVQLARAWLKLNRPADALEVLQPLVDELLRRQSELRKEASGSAAASGTSGLREQQRDSAQAAELAELENYNEAWVVLANVLLHNDRFEEAAAAASVYLDLEPNGANALQALVVRAQARARSGQDAPAREDAERLMSRFGRSREALDCLFVLAELAYQRQQWKWAERLYRHVVEAVQKSPSLSSENEAAALSGLAWSLYKQQEYDEAIQRFDELLAGHPPKALAAEAAFARAMALHESGSSEAAAKALLRVAHQYAGTHRAVEAAQAAGRILARLGQTDQADSAYELAHAQLLKLPPDQRNGLDDLLREWAALNVSAERYARAGQVFRLLVQEAPDSRWADEARYALAENDLLAGRLDEAAGQFAQLAAKSDAAPDVRRDALFRLVQIAATRQQWEQVEQRAAELERLFPENPYRNELQFQVAQALLRSGRADEAAKKLQPLVERLKTEKGEQAEWWPHAWVLLAEAWFQLKKYKQVEELARQFAERFSNSRFAYRMDDVLGRAYKRQARFDEAREAFTRVVQSVHGRRTETAAQAQLLIAETYFLQKDYRTAQLEYLKVYHLYSFPEWQAAGLLQAGVCDELLGNWADAARTFELLLNRFPDSSVAEQARERLRRARKKAKAAGVEPTSTGSR